MLIALSDRFVELGGYKLSSASQSFAQVVYWLNMYFINKLIDLDIIICKIL